MKRFLGLALVGILLTACDKNEDILVNIHTSMGSMKVLLYDETPLHKKNFIELAKSGRYDSTKWHRIMNGFMVQGGDIYEKEGSVDNPNNRIPAEFVPGMMHTKGTLAAARQPDQYNPKKMSSSCQFYLVQGKVFTELEMTTDINALRSGIREVVVKPEYDTLRTRFVNLQSQGRYADMDQLMYECLDLVKDQTGYTLTKEVSPEVLEAYTTVGGAPHLDNEYTIFGRVVEGIEVIDLLAAVETNAQDRPIENIYLTMEIETMNKKEVTKRYGYIYPEN